MTQQRIKSHFWHLIFDKELDSALFSFSIASFRSRFTLSKCNFQYIILFTKEMWDNELPTSSFWTRDQPYRWPTKNDDEKLWIGAKD